jgi:hypothetical protein
MKKAKILIKYFGVYGLGNFDLTLEEVDQIIEILTTKEGDFLDINLKEIYDRLYKTRMG